LKQDELKLDHLADALMEDIIAASGDDLLAEVREDFGDAGILAVAFDQVLAGTEALALQLSHDAAIGNLANALSEDIAATAPETLLREAAEDYGDRRALAVEFDSALLGNPAPPGATKTASAGASIAGAEWRQALARPVPRSRLSKLLKAAFARLSETLAAPMRPRIALGAIATALLVAILAPGFWFLEMSAEHYVLEQARINAQEEQKRPAEQARIGAQEEQERPAEQARIGAQEEQKRPAEQARIGAQEEQERRGEQARIAALAAVEHIAERELGNTETARKFLEIAARDGDVGAAWKLGRMYADGDGVKQNQQLAFEYFAGIANSHALEPTGSAQARFVANAFVRLGIYYLKGIADSNIKPDAVRSRDMFNYAASYFGDPEAQYHLGRLYLDGQGVAKDTKLGIRWLSVAADKGQYQAQAVLGALLFTGQSVPRDAARGLMWLMLARDAATPGEAWITDQYTAAWRQATETERLMALNFLEKRIEQHGGRRQ
jgi:uncharacterized protein